MQDDPNVQDDPIFATAVIIALSIALFSVNSGKYIELNPKYDLFCMFVSYTLQ